MRVYLASWFNSKDSMSTRATELRAAGIEVTSRWLEETVSSNVQIKDVSEAYLRETAQVDIEDILLANVVVLNIPSAEDLKSPDMPIASWARGGRHFEAGFHYATMMFRDYLPNKIKLRGYRKLVLVGHKENVFHYLDGLNNLYADNVELPEISVFNTWEKAKDHLIKLSEGSECQSGL